MFTGIIQELGVVRRVTEAGGVRRLVIDLGELGPTVKPGDSVNINGVCLTVAEAGPEGTCFEVIPETLARSNLGRLKVGQRVNAECSLAVGGRLDGHFVQGHVDGLVRVERIDRAGGEYRLWFAAEPELMRYVVPKGSVALDGVSLTLADLEPGRFSVALIPTTLRETTLGLRQIGDRVNLETDLLVRAVARLLETGRFEKGGGVTWEMLREHGFVGGGSRQGAST